ALPSAVFCLSSLIAAAYRVTFDETAFERSRTIVSCPTPVVGTDSADATAATFAPSAVLGIESKPFCVVFASDFGGDICVLEVGGEAAVWLLAGAGTVATDFVSGGGKPIGTPSLAARFGGLDDVAPVCANRWAVDDGDTLLAASNLSPKFTDAVFAAF